MTDETLFAAALEKPDPTARAAYLDSACQDPETRKRLDALLAAHDKAGEFLNRPAVERPAPESAPTRAYSPETDHTRTHGGTMDTDTDEALGFLAPPKRPDSLGRIGHYEVLEVLGRGGFGIVFRAFDDTLQRVVAVKVLAPSMAATSPARKRFLREARSSAAVRHENVVQVHAVEEAPLPYLVMEFIPGETLQQRLDRTGPLEVAEILRIGRQVAAGLAAAHETGLIHRDIKPSNILIDSGPEARIKITDFGLARAADDASISQSGVVAGTPMYMAPEQAKGDALDHRADLFSLGSVLYVMCSGRPPFRASGTLAVLKRVVEEEPRPIREIIPEVPDWLCRIIAKLHAKDPAERYQSAKEVAEVLADCEKQLRTSAVLTDYSRIPGGKPEPIQPAPMGVGPILALILGPILIGGALLALDDYWPAGLIVGGALAAIIPIVLISRRNKLRPGTVNLATGSTNQPVSPPWTDHSPMWSYVVFMFFALIGAGFFANMIGRSLAPQDFDEWNQSWEGTVAFGALGLVLMALIFWRTRRQLARTPLTAGTATPMAVAAPRIAWWKWAAAPLAIVILIGTLLFGRAAMLYVADRGEMEIAAIEGFNEVIVLRNDRGVYDENELKPLITDWMGMERGRTLKLPPGTYQLNAGIGPGPGRKAIHWKVIRSGPFGSTTEMLPGLGHMGWSVIVAVERGERLSIWPVPEELSAISRRHREEIDKIQKDVDELRSGSQRFVPLFNGKDLTGWKPSPHSPGDWRVEDGAIVGRNGPGYLFSTKPYENFHLRLEAKINARGNSGVSFGQRHQIEIRNDPLCPTGSLLEFKPDRTPAIIRHPDPCPAPDTWFTLEIRAAGRTVSTRINGGEWRWLLVDRAEMLPPAPLELEALDAQTEVRFRKIEILELPAGPSVQGRPIPGWGTAVDPKGDCKFDLGVNGLSITVPRGRYNLNPTPAYNNVSAPRVLRPVEGDFQIETRVEDFPPPPRGPANITDNYNGAGLLLWRDSRNFVRFTRSTNGQTGFVFFHLENFRDGRMVGGGNMSAPRQTASLRIVRTGSNCRFYISTDGTTWREYPTKGLVTFPGKVDVGVCAINTTEAPFTARFHRSELRSGPSGRSEESFTALFNGKNLTGWSGKFPEAWTVENGVLTGRGKNGSAEGWSELIHSRNDFRDFHLRAEARMSATGWASIRFRKQKDSLRGYKIWLSNEPDKTGARTGRMDVDLGDDDLLITHPPEDFQVPAGQWFTLDLTARGQELDLAINGKILAQVRDATFERGEIQLEVAGADAVIQFRKLEIRDLPPARKGPHPRLIRRFDPATDRPPVPLRGNAKDIVSVEDGAWRIENAFDHSVAGNFNVNFGTLVEGIPDDGILILKAKVKLAPKHKDAWGDLMLGDASPSFHGYNWPKELATYQGEITEWTDKEVRYPVEIFRKKNPPSVSILAGLHANGVLWIKDVELLHLPAQGNKQDVPSPDPAVSPFDEKTAKEHQGNWARHLGIPVEYTNSLGMSFRLIPPGQFEMGSTPEQVTSADEQREISPPGPQRPAQPDKPRHRISISEPYYLGTHEVTVGQFREFVAATKYRTTAEKAKGGWVYERHLEGEHEGGPIGQDASHTWNNPKLAGGDSHPVILVTAADAAAFCAWLGEKDGLRYAVPTEEQWETACRAGTTTRWFFGDDPAAMKKYGWTHPHSGREHHPVGRLAANPFGLHDLYGNVGEITLGAKGELVERGGDEESSPFRARSASRAVIDKTVDPYYRRGFRVAIVGPLKPTPRADRPDPAVLQPLRELVAATARTRDQVKARFDAGTVSRIALLAAEADLVETRIRLAEAEGNRDDVIALHEVLVAHRREERDLIAARVELGADAQDVLNRADARLADAQARLAKVKPPTAAAPTPRPRK